MTSVLLVVPYEELQERFETCVAQQDTRDIQIDICHLRGSHFSDIDLNKYHVIAARGITGYSIREHHPKAAFVEIAVTSDDIINTLSMAYGVSVPLFIDNAESVTRLETSASQVIRLVVSENDKELRVNYGTEN